MDTRRPDDASPKTAAEWFTALTEPQADAATRGAFTDWVRESPTRIREIMDLVLLKEDLQAARVDDATLQAWVEEARTSSVESLKHVATTHVAPKRRWLARPRAWAAAAALAFLCITAAAMWWSQGERYDTHLGEQRLISLRDGSMVSLNTNSRVRVELSERARTVELSRGEAYFDVKRDPSRPFSVVVGDTVVIAIGTAFNVRALPEGAMVSVAEGKVEVRSRLASKAAPVALSGGERAVVSKRAAVTRLPHVKAGHAAAWMQGRIEFEAATLEEVIREFARYRRLEVGFADDELRQRRITGSFNARDPEAVLAYIGTLPGIRVEQIREDEFLVTHDGE